MNHKLVIPLFNVVLEKPLQLILAEDKFVKPLTFFLLPEPILLHGKKKIQKCNEPIRIPIPIPNTTIYFLPWPPEESAEVDISHLLPVQQFPPDFDVFDNLGPFALRAGPGGLGGFQTQTTASTKLHAKGLLIIELDQVYPKNIEEIIRTSNPYESDIVESLLDGLRLFSGNEPHQHKGFHLNNNQFVDLVTKWPLTEIQGPALNLTSSDMENLKNTFLQVWQIRRDSRESKSCKIINIALEYYYLSSTITITRVIFLYLMIAFESLFKREDENSASAASSRIAKLLAGTKAEHNEIRRFMWNTESDSGCCQVRNQIVHGNTTTLSSNMFWELKRLIRTSILRIIHFVLSSEIDRQQYYESLEIYVNDRFQQLTNN